MLKHLAITPNAESLPQPWQRERSGHKGDYGCVLFIGGSRGMAGAMGLAGIAALRSGAGLIRLAVPEPILETVASFHPCYMTVPLPADSAGQFIKDSRDELQVLAAAADVVACGPGIGRSDDVRSLVMELWQTLSIPAVFDADALFALATTEPLPRAAGPRIITPHPGEFSRLSGISASQTEAQRAAAHDWARKNASVVVLKGHRTLITDGELVVENQNGNPGMATGGSGDVLTGIIAALVGQGLSPLAAAQLGVYLHGLAGDLAANALGEISMTALDLPAYLPHAFQRWKQSTRD